MQKKVIGVGLLAGGIALAGLAGSAYAEGGTPAGKPTAVPVKGHGSGAIACAAPGKGVKGKPEKGVVAFKSGGRLPGLVTAKPGKPGKPAFAVRGGNGKALPAPPSGAKGTAGFLKGKAGPGTVKIGAPPKGVHCFRVKPGTPGAPPPLPTR